MAAAQSELIAEQGAAQQAGCGQQHAANAALQLEAVTEALANLILVCKHSTTLSERLPERKFD